MGNGEILYGFSRLRSNPFGEGLFDDSFRNEEKGNKEQKRKALGFEKQAYEFLGDNQSSIDMKLRKANRPSYCCGDVQGHFCSIQ
jgi:hypothetical protein